jgi:polyamine oxidase
MRQIERFVSAASLPVARLLEDAGLKGPLVAEATAAIEAPALAAQRDLRVVLPTGEATAPTPQIERGDAVDWLVGLLPESVVAALAPKKKGKATAKRGAKGAAAGAGTPRSALAASLRPSRKIQSTLELLRTLSASDGARVTAALAAADSPDFIVHVPIDLEFTLGRSARISFAESLLRARELMRVTNGRVLPLVPFDPRRPGALAFVREAISRGFVGVSFEPRHGVKVLGNGSGAAAREIERTLLDLYTYCADANVPLHIPCESSFDAASPDVRGRLRDLKKLLSARRFTKLRLLIGGVGSLDGWAGAKRGDRAAFLRSEAGTALSLAETFPNVFCESAASWPDGARSESAIRTRIEDAAQRKRAIDEKLVGAERPQTIVEWLRLTSLSLQPVGWTPQEEDAIRAAIGRATAIERPMPRMAARSPLRAMMHAAAPAPTAAAAATPTRVDCLVLGAGISGVTAARNLATWRRPDGSSPSVVILEGSQRIGGRMHTLRDVGLPIPVEMGAELIHRPEADQASGGFRLWDEVHRYGLETRPIDKLSSNRVYFNPWTSSPGGPRLRDAMGTCSDLDVGNAKRVLDAAMRFRRGADRSALQLRDEVLADFNARRPNAEDMSDYLLTGTVPGELSDLSVAGLASDRVKEQQFSSEEYHVADGYDALPRLIGQGVAIEFGAVVKRLEWWHTDDDSGVRAILNDGRVFEAGTAICTFSIGVLQHGDVEFARVLPDAPLEGLPPEKREAIDRIGFGPESKLILQFRRRFWTDDFSILSRAGRDRLAGRSYFNPTYGAPGSPAILTAFHTRQDARRLDQLVGEPERWKGDGKPEDAIETYINEHVLPDLIAMLDVRPAQRPTLADVQYWHCRCWANDPLVRGGTSYLKFAPGTSADAMRGARAAFADPASTLPLFWAGEAAAVNTNPWSVHGAHMSGVAAALAVSRHLTPA